MDSYEEKKYKEALERAKKELDACGSQDCDAAKQIFRLFPELAENAENEDEKIRKEIIECVKNYGPSSANPQLFKNMLAWLEKQGEHKLADKLEPKFNEGDWIVNNERNNIVKVLEVNKHYRLDYCDAIGTVIVELIDNDYHLWTIADAKDGDVLAASDGSIFLFAGVVDWGCKYYSALATDGTVKFNEGLKHFWETSTAVHPATKEQRDALMKAMADAGYTFDFEKRELNKIDNEEIDGEDYGIDGLWHAQRILEKTLGSVDGYQSDDGILDHKAAITAVKKLYEQNPAWSEEDIEMLNSAISFVEHSAFTTIGKGKNNVISWLKSLKDRVQPQPKQE